MQTGPNVKPTAQLRDPSAWYHIVLAVDTTQATAANRVKFYINGEHLTDITTETYPAQNLDTPIGDDVVHRVGVAPNASSSPFDGYLAEVYMINGTQLAASDFGELDSTTNQWIPLDSDDVKDAVTFGTNGFFQKYNSTELAASFADDASYIWTCPDGVTTVDYLVVGGGGGGGHSSADYSGGGGGAGGYRAGTGFSVTPGTEYTITVGAGGAAGSGSLGTSGGDSTFSTKAGALSR